MGVCWEGIREYHPYIIPMLYIRRFPKIRGNFLGIPFLRIIIRIIIVYWGKYYMGKRSYPPSFSTENL